MGRLTSLEHRVMRLLVLGLANRAVAQELGITERVAERYILSVLKKLGLSSRAQLADCIRGQRRSPVGGDATATPNAVGERKQLTARELEVAALVGRGLTNREIGAELVITE